MSSFQSGLIGLVLLLVFAIVVAMVWLYRQRLQVLPKPKEIVLEAGAPSDGRQLGPAPRIPQRIWTYWHTPELPLVVQRCIDGWRRHHPDWTIEVLHPMRLHEFLDEVPDGLGRLNIAKQTDWIRLALLARHGGVWMDASIILTQPLNWVDDAREASGADFVGFYLEGYTQQPQYPVIESWFLAAAPGSAFITQWLKQFRRDVIDGETTAYLQHLREQGRYETLTQKIGDPAYHTIHVVAQDVIQTSLDNTAATPWRLYLLRAEDTAYWLHLQSGWKRKPLFARLLWAKGDAAHWPALVKLRGGERSKLEWWLAKGYQRRQSLAERHLAPKED